MASSHTAAPSTTSSTASTPVLPPKPSITSAELHRSVADSSSAIERTLLLECNTLLLQQPHSPTVSRIAPGPSASASLQSKQQQNHHITHHYERLSYERDSKLAMLTNEIGTVNMRLQELAAHKKRLLDQVAMCDQEIGALNARSTALGADLTNNTRYYQQQLEQLANTGEFLPDRTKFVPVLGFFVWPCRCM
jgi:septal ring factor EnvC (AmiA/AmiB activator)